VSVLRYLRYMLELHVIVLCWNLLFQDSENFFPCRTKFFRMTTKFTFPISKQMVSMVVANLLGRNGLQIVWCCWLELGAVAAFSCVQIQHIAKVGLPFLLSCFAKSQVPIHYLVAVCCSGMEWLHFVTSMIDLSRKHHYIFDPVILWDFDELCLLSLSFVVS